MQINITGHHVDVTDSMRDYLKEKFDKLDEIDGNDIVKGTLRVGYDATSGMAGQFIVVNNESAL